MLQVSCPLHPPLLLSPTCVSTWRIIRPGPSQPRPRHTQLGLPEHTQMWELHWGAPAPTTLRPGSLGPGSQPAGTHLSASGGLRSVWASDRPFSLVSRYCASPSSEDRSPGCLKSSIMLLSVCRRNDMAGCFLPSPR